jgi:dihydrofolate reductase
MDISLIVASTRQGVIGKNNSLPWHIPEDLKYFKEKTLGHPIIMGRKTYDSIGRPLPRRNNLVISRQSELKISGCEVFPSLSTSLEFAKTNLNAQEIFVIGGAEIFKQALSFATKLYITWVEKNIEGDIVLPQIDFTQFKLSFDEAHLDAPLPFRFCLYEKTHQ